MRVMPPARHVICVRAITPDGPARLPDRRRGRVPAADPPGGRRSGHDRLAKTPMIVAFYHARLRLGLTKRKTTMSETMDSILGLTAQIVSAHVAKNTVEPDRLPELIREVYRTLANMGEEPSESTRPKPVVALSKSVFPDHVVCVECGKKMKMLKRHLMTDHKLTPDQYRARWGLPASYPMVCRQLCEDPFGAGKEDRAWPETKSSAARSGASEARTQHPSGQSGESRQGQGLHPWPHQEALPPGPPPRAVPLGPFTFVGRTGGGHIGGDLPRPQVEANPRPTMPPSRSSQRNRWIAKAVPLPGGPGGQRPPGGFQGEALTLLVFIRLACSILRVVWSDPPRADRLCSEPARRGGQDAAALSG